MAEEGVIEHGPARQERATASAGHTLLDGFLRSPLSGLLPWIAMSLVNGPGRFEEAACVALGMSALFFALGYQRGGANKPLEFFDIAYFAGLAALAVFAPVGPRQWMEQWSGEIANLALVAFAVVSIVARVPFTLPYAREDTPREYWDSPGFLRVNYRITTAWTLSFVLSLLSGAYGDLVLHDSDNFWTAWIIQIAGTLMALSFTEWYPSVVRAREGADPGADPPPSLWKLFEFMPVFVLVVGISLIATESGPTSLGVALIAAGGAAAAAQRALGRRSPAPGG
jgi:hypothetical protein